MKITYQELEKIVQKSKLGVRVKVDSNPYGEGDEQVLTFITDKYNYLSTCCFDQYKIDDIYYAYLFYDWQNKYKGTFELVEEPPKKPELYAKGDWVLY